MTQNLKSTLLKAFTLGVSALSLSACSTHYDSSSRYGGSSASAACYSDCGVYWVNRVVAIPTTHTVQTMYVKEPAEIVEKEVIKEVIVEKEVYVNVPCPPPPPCPATGPCPISEPCPEVGYPEPPTPWTPPPVLRK